MAKIGLISYVKNLFASDQYITDFSDLFVEDTKYHLKQTALDTVIGKIINASSLVQFKTDDKILNHRLNVAPNHNENASDFRSRVIKKMLLEGECLIIKENNMFFIADSFVCDEKAVSQNFYHGIVINNLVWRKTYFSNEVYHLKYHNDKLKKYLNDLDASYGKLFGRLLQIHMREQQIRVYAKFKMLTKIKDETPEETAERSKRTLKEYLHGVKQEIENESVAILPRQQDYDVEEKTQNHVGRSVDELSKLEQMYVRQVADILQVPPLIFSGELADVSEHNNNFVRWCIRPLMGIIADEFNATYFSRFEYEKGKHISVNTVWVIYNSEFEMAKDTRTMIESAVWTVDDVLELQGKPRLNTKVTTQRYLTKNMAPLNNDGTVQDNKNRSG